MHYVIARDEADAFESRASGRVRSRCGRRPSNLLPTFQCWVLCSEMQIGKRCAEKPNV